MSHILIIDEDEEMIRLERDYLEINSYQVFYELSGIAGVRHAMDKEVSLVLLSVNLPDIDGFEVCKRIRKKRNIPILFVSERTSEIDLIRGLGVGADDYIRKPFSPNELIARVKAHLACYERLKKKDTGDTHCIKYPGISIDKEARRVYLDGVETSFTTKEFDLLCFLASHPNHVYSKDELFREVWGMNSLGDIATVTVHIKKIRKKMGQGTIQAGYIETVWGSGYRFRVLYENDMA